MSIRRWVLVITGVACLIAPATSPAHRDERNAQHFAVKSTLDGKTVLPHRVHWIARPKGATRIVTVEFLIDGKVRWIEREAPYTYGDDGNWLVTSALTPGAHRFTVRARAANGTTAQQTTSARVLVATPPPPELGGTSWQRTVTPEEAGFETPGGTWTISVDEAGWRIRDPEGYDNWIDAAYLSGTLVQLRGGIWLHPNDSTVRRGGNGWCSDTNAPVDYTWALSADTLTITLGGADACGPSNAKQDRIVAGTWSRAS